MKLLFNISFYVAFISVILAIVGSFALMGSGNDWGILIGIGALAQSLVLLLGLTFMRLVERHLCQIAKA